MNETTKDEGTTLVMWIVEVVGSNPTNKLTVQLKIPGLQPRYRAHECIACGAAADMYCAGCELAPYCSERCQRRDWTDRHKSVCHNLARLNSGASKTRPEPVPEPEPVVPPAAPLRRPNNFKRDPPPQDDEKPKNTKFIPSGERAQAIQAVSKNKPSPVRSNRNFNGNKQEMRRPLSEKNDDETWENKPQQSKPSPEAVPAQASTSASKTVTPADLVSFVKPKPKEPETAAELPMKKVPVKESLAKEVPVKDVPVKKAPVKMEPENYIVEKLAIGDSFLASVEAPASECATKQPGFVCLTMHTDFEQIYNKLCEDYTLDCDKQEGNVTPSPGMLVSYLSEEDGGWYRARLLTDSRAALLDAARLTNVDPKQCKPMLQQYQKFPEFCAVIHGNGLETGANLKCTLKSKTENGFKVGIVNAESGADIGEGEVSRWMPEVEMPAPVAGPSASSSIPSVPRPSVKDGDRVVLLDVATLKQASVRPHNATAMFDSILHDVVLYGTKAIPLKEPPVSGQVVVAQYTDGVHYRALVKRTKAAQNKYLIEYIEYGNEEVAPLERLFHCPEELNLTNVPALATIVQLSNKETASLTPPAVTYIDKLKDENEELILTIPNGEKTAPSGSLVNLIVAKNKELFNVKLEELCTPDWKKLEERGGDVLETDPVMYSEIKNAVLPVDREFTATIVDLSAMSEGTVFGYLKGNPLADVIFGPLTEKINQYCESDLCRIPYLPRLEELCLTRFGHYRQWFRAVVLEQIQGPGGLEVLVLYIDYGNMAVVSVKDLRKMLPEFVEGYPALASQIDIEDFPKPLTERQEAAAIEMMNMTEGRGTLEITKCRLNKAESCYKVQAPAFVAALRAIGTE